MNMGLAANPVRQSAKVRPHIRMLQGSCREGILIIVRMTARLPRNAKMAEDPLTATSRMLFMKVAVSFLGIPTQLGSPQMVAVLLEAILSSKDLIRFLFNRLNTRITKCEH